MHNKKLLFSKKQLDNIKKNVFYFKYTKKNELRFGQGTKLEIRNLKDFWLKAEQGKISILKSNLPHMSSGLLQNYYSVPCFLITHHHELSGEKNRNMVNEPI